MALSNSGALDKSQLIGCNDPDGFNMFVFAAYYCRQDCRVLKKAMIKFDEILQDEFDMKMEESLSISTVSMNHQKNCGAFKDVYCVKG